MEDGYPDPRNFGEIPAYGFFIRHVEGVEFNNVTAGFEREDARPAFILEDVKGAEFNNVDTQRAGEGSRFVLRNVEDFRAHRCGGVADVMLERAEEKSL